MFLSQVTFLSLFYLYGVERDKNTQLCDTVFNDLSFIFTYICMMAVHMCAGAREGQNRGVET